MRLRNFPTNVIAALAVSLVLGCNGDGGGLPAGPEAAADDPCDPDELAPAIASVSANPNVLWAPEHKLVSITIGVTASDDCSPVTSEIVGVSSNEPINGLGDGNTAPDWIITGPLTLKLRSERSGPAPGRVYTITVRARDASDNVATAIATVLVPHDQGS